MLTRIAKIIRLARLYRAENALGRRISATADAIEDTKIQARAMLAIAEEKLARAETAAAVAPLEFRRAYAATIAARKAARDMLLVLAA